MQSIYRIVKVAAERLEIGKKKIWPHLLRKSFRKVLNRSDLDEDTREALMGHKLPGSRANYFDFHDIDEIEQKYASCNFSREAGANAMRLFTEQLKKKEQDIEKLKETIAKMQPLVEFVNSFNSPRELKEILDFLKDDSMVHSSYDPTIQFDKSIADKVNEIAKRNDITQAEALGQLAEVEWKRIVEDDEKRKKLAKARGLSLTREDYKEQKKKRRLRK
jgi:hypothetical protein